MPPVVLCKTAGIMQLVKILLLSITFGTLSTSQVQGLTEVISDRSVNEEKTELLGVDMTFVWVNPGFGVLARDTTTESKVLSVTDKTELSRELLTICACESTGRADGIPRHYEDDGITVVRGRINENDVGICQINLTYHQKEAERMGLDLFKEEDNIAYANYLFETQGYTPWRSSQYCHGK